MLLILIPVGVYAIFMFFILFGILKLSRQTESIVADLPSVSLIIPFRNEKLRANALLASLKKVNYPLSKLQIIFVNDHSDDSSVDDFEKFTKTTRFETLLIFLPKGIKGKKAALELGLMHAKAEFILFTDADCVLNSQWIVNMLSFAKKTKADMVLGPVSMFGKGFIGKFQMAEFLSLQAVTLGTAGFGKAVLSNGANMLIRNDCLRDLENPFKREVSSGDDVFLLDTLQKQGRNIQFNFHPHALVKTPASETLPQLLNQRARWLSKTKKYSLNFSLLIASVFGLLQIMIFTIALLFIYNGQWAILILFLLYKLVFDHLIFLSVSLNMKIKLSVFYTSLLSVLYPFWTIVSSMAAFFIKPKWKGRAINV